MHKTKVGQFDIAYWESGKGPGIIFAHCSSANHKEWLTTAQQYISDYRVLIPDLIGYGKSTPWPAVIPENAASDIDVIEHLLDMFDGPVHLIAHSYGAAACLEVARMHSERATGKIRSLFLIEPVSFHLLKTENCEKEWKQISRVAARCVTAANNGNLAAAANSYMGFWLGFLKWRLSPGRFRDSVIKTVNKVAYEFSILPYYTCKAIDYACIECPCTLVSGGRSKKPALKIVEILANHIKHSKHLSIPDAGHMSPFTHQQKIKELIGLHLNQYG